MNYRSKIILVGAGTALIFYLTDTITGYLQSDDPVLSLMTFTRLAGLVFIVLMTIILLIWDKAGAGTNGKAESRTSSASISERMNPLLLSAIFNQFKLPLNVIAGFSRLMRNPDLNPNTRNMYSDYIYQNSTPLLLLAENVIDLFTLETKQITITNEECDVNKIFDEVFREFTHENSQDQQNEDMSPGLTRSGHTEELIIRSDCKRLKQVLLNLVTNSFQFSDLSSIETGYKVKEGFLEFYVKDEIRNLSIDNLDAIYADYKINSAIQNQSLIVAALRLTIAQKLIRALNGEIWTETAGGNRKNTHFKLPLEILAEPEESAKLEETGEAPAWDAYKLLIAEDIESNYIYLREILKPTNIKVTWARNGKEAVEFMEKYPDFDVILMDILMPEMDGYEAASKIKELNRDIPIVIQTAYSLESESKETLDNFNDYLTKPIWSSDLIRVLSKFLESSAPIDD